MTLMRKHSVDQMKRIEREIVKQGGTLDRTNPAEKNMANNLFMHDPFDADSKGVRKIATAEEFFKNDIPDAKTSVKMKKENMKHINESKIADAIQNAIEEFYYDDNSDSIETISELTGLSYDLVVSILDISTAENAMENLMEQPSNESKVLKFEMFCEGKKEVKEPEEKTVPEINREIKTIANWHSENSPKREFNVNLIGKFIDNGKVKGYIQRIEGTTVFVDSIVEPLGIVKLPIKDVVKGLSYNNAIGEFSNDGKIMKVADFSITGPNNKSVGVKPSDGKSKSVDKTESFKKFNCTATKADDQKISDKNNIVKFSK